MTVEPLLIETLLIGRCYLPSIIKLSIGLVVLCQFMDLGLKTPIDDLVGIVNLVIGGSCSFLNKTSSVF